MGEKSRSALFATRLEPFSHASQRRGFYSRNILVRGCSLSLMLLVTAAPGAESENLVPGFRDQHCVLPLR
jgi:hypothetical protein